MVLAQGLRRLWSRYPVKATVIWRFNTGLEDPLSKMGHSDGRCWVLARCLLVPCHVDLFYTGLREGVFMTWQLAFPRESDQRVLEITYHCTVFFPGQHSSLWKGAEQGCYYQDGMVTGGRLGWDFPALCFWWHVVNRWSVFVHLVLTSFSFYYLWYL